MESLDLVHVVLLAFCCFFLITTCWIMYHMAKITCYIHDIAHVFDMLMDKTAIWKCPLNGGDKDELAEELHS